MVEIRESDEERQMDGVGAWIGVTFIFGFGSMLARIGTGVRATGGQTAPPDGESKACGILRESRCRRRQGPPSPSLLPSEVGRIP